MGSTKIPSATTYYNRQKKHASVVKMIYNKEITEKWLRQDYQQCPYGTKQVGVSSEKRRKRCCGSAVAGQAIGKEFNTSTLSLLSPRSRQGEVVSPPDFNSLSHWSTPAPSLTFLACDWTTSSNIGCHTEASLELVGD